MISGGSTSSDKHVHGMKKLREQAFTHINAQLLDEHHQKGPKLPNPRFIFHNKIPKSGICDFQSAKNVQLVTH